MTTREIGALLFLKKSLGVLRCSSWLPSSSASVLMKRLQLARPQAGETDLQTDSYDGDPRWAESNGIGHTTEKRCLSWVWGRESLLTQPFQEDAWPGLQGADQILPRTLCLRMKESTRMSNGWANTENSMVIPQKIKQRVTTWCGNSTYEHAPKRTESRT